jgi:signal peptidase I
MGRQGVSDSEKPVNSNAPDEMGKAGSNEWREYGLFLLKLAAIVLVFRTVIFTPFSIPSESMQPRLLIGDYLLVSKWPYGISRYSIPFSPPLFKDRIFGSLPERGDIVVFRPQGKEDDYIKRAIGLPGDIVSMNAGFLEINGKPIPKQRIADAIIPITQNMIEAAEREQMKGYNAHPCWKPEYEERAADGSRFCRYRQFRETLPNGVSYNIFDIADGLPGDDTEPLVVPDGHVLFMGDNRDRSGDGRRINDPNDPRDDDWIGPTPVENIVGRAQLMWFSTDGSARWLLPWTWFSAARPERMGKGF